MSVESRFARIADENFIASFRKLAQHVDRGETRETGTVFSFVTGLPLRFFNGCVVIQEAPPSDVAASLAWLSERDVPFRVSVAERLVADLSDLLDSHGLRPDLPSYPGMVLHPIPELPASPPDIEVAPISDARLDEFTTVLEEGGLEPELAHRLISPAFAADPDVRLFIGRLDGRPVGTSIAIRSRHASGVYNVGTLPEARRRGVGTALTWAAIEAGRAWGYDTIVLQASAMGLPLYSQMGFRTVAPYVVFAAA